MPYLQTQDEEELKKQQETGSQNISGQSTVLSSGSAPKGERSSGSYVNLNQYLDANKGKSEVMGEKIAGDISSQGQKAREGVTNTLTDFKQLADQGTISGLDTAQNEASDIVSAARTKGNLEQAQLNRFKDISNAAYKGPADLTGSSKYAGTEQQIQKAQEARQNANTDEGRFNLLQNAYARPTYSQGQKNLDNLLITGNEGAKNKIQSTEFNKKEFIKLEQLNRGLIV